MKSATALNITQQVLFTSGEGGYHTYRIPALAVAADGTVLAVLQDQTIGCLYAWGSSVYRLEHDQRWIEHVSFARFNVEWATQGGRRQD